MLVTRKSATVVSVEPTLYPAVVPPASIMESLPESSESGLYPAQPLVRESATQSAYDLVTASAISSEDAKVMVTSHEALNVSTASAASDPAAATTSEAATQSLLPPATATAPAPVFVEASAPPMSEEDIDPTRPPSFAPVQIVVPATEPTLAELHIEHLQTTLADKQKEDEEKAAAALGFVNK